MKKTKKTIEPIKSKFYRLDPSKPIAVEGHRSAFPIVLLLVAIFFCAILAFIVIVNKDDETYDESAYMLFYILCGVLLGVAVILNVAYVIRKVLVRKRILASDVTRATITFVSVEEYTTRDNDGDTHTKERVSLTYEFYDKLGNKRAEHLHKTYGKAPDFYEGQQIVIAFDETKCYVLSKYALLDDDMAENSSSNSALQSLTGETLNINVDKYAPLGYNKTYYIMAGVYLALSVFVAALMTYFALTVKDNFVWVYLGMLGIFFTIPTVLAIISALIPFRAKRRYDAILAVGATYTHGVLECTNKVYGNNAASKYLCKYVDLNGDLKQFNVEASQARKRVRYNDTEVIVAYAQDKAVALVPKSDLKIVIR